MKLRKFNFGGVFGGLVCAAAAGVILYLLANEHFPLKGIKIVALAGFGGAALGNWIWGLAAPSDLDDFQWPDPLSGDQNQLRS